MEKKEWMFDLSEVEYEVTKRDGFDVLVVRERAETLEEWVNRVYYEYQNVPSTEALTYCNGRYTYAFDAKGNVAKACCSYKDRWDRKTGDALAYARLKGIEVHPDLVPVRPTKTPAAAPKVAGPTTRTMVDWYGDPIKTDMSVPRFYIKVNYDNNYNNELKGAILPVIKGVLKYPEVEDFKDGKVVFSHVDYRGYDCTGTFVSKRDIDTYDANCGDNPGRWICNEASYTCDDYTQFDESKDFTVTIDN